MMSLLTRKAPHKVQVQNRKSVRNDRGLREYVPDGPPVTVKCMGEPVRDWSSSEEVETLGLQVVDLTIIRAKTWPGDVNSYVLYNGAEYETVGAPQHHSVGKRTSHWRVTIKWLRDL